MYVLGTTHRSEQSAEDVRQAVEVSLPRSSVLATSNHESSNKLDFSFDSQLQINAQYSDTQTSNSMGKFDDTARLIAVAAHPLVTPQLSSGGHEKCWP